MLKTIFEESKFLNYLLGDPLKTGEVNFTLVFVGLAAFSLLCLKILKHVSKRSDEVRKFLKKVWGSPELPDISNRSIWDLFFSPIKASVKTSASLLSDLVREHYYSNNWGRLVRKYWLNVIGAAVISCIIFTFAWMVIVLSTGVSLGMIDKLLVGDWNQRVDVTKSLLQRYYWITTPALLLFGYAVINISKVSFLEQKFWNLRRIGLAAALDMAEWDETPKLTIPKESLIESAHHSIKELLSGRDTDQIRIKMASGFKTLREGGYLNELLTRPNSTWKILLLNPDSDGAKRRAAAYLSERASDPPEFANAEEYLKGIRDTLNYLQKVKAETNANIHVRLYSHTPQWRIIIFSGYCVVSGFGPGQRSDRAPTAIFEKLSTSHYHGYEEMFEDLWHNSSEVFIE